MELRSEHNISQQKLADKIGISQSTIAQIEKNRNEATASTIRKLAKFFEVSTDYLLELENDYGAKIDALTSEHTGAGAFTREESKLIEKYRELNAPGKKLIDTTINTLLTASSENESKRKI